MRFSIIVVSYQAGDKLPMTIKSIKQQTYEDYEIIVKDGGSTDGSVEQLLVDEKLIIKKESDTGIYDAMNQGIAYAHGEYVLFLNCGDTFYKESVLEEIVEVLEQYPRKGIYYGETYQELSGAIEVMPHEISSFTCYRHMPCHQAIIYERTLFQERKYHTQYRIRGDYDHFLWSYFVKGIRPQYMDVVIASYEGGGYSESKENEKRSAWEHRAITNQYIPRMQLFMFRTIMVLSLASLRGKIASSKSCSQLYSKLKQMIYQKG